ncbi:hypothetical protein P7K49_001181, partial [Saguinus oedipus]
PAVRLKCLEADSVYRGLWREQTEQETKGRLPRLLFSVNKYYTLVSVYSALNQLQQETKR